MTLGKVQGRKTLQYELIRQQDKAKLPWAISQSPRSILIWSAAPLTAPSRQVMTGQVSITSHLRVSLGQSDDQTYLLHLGSFRWNPGSSRVSYKIIKESVVESGLSSQRCIRETRECQHNCEYPRSDLPVWLSFDNIVNKTDFLEGKNLE